MIFDKWYNRSAALSDSSIAVRVQEALHRYAPLASTRPVVQVEVVGGVATLRGVVRGSGQRGMAGQLAAAVDGVTAVRNELQDDPTIEGVVARALATDPRVRLSTRTIRIKSFNGVVILSGPVLTQAQQLAAEAVTRRIPGVIDVANRLVVLPKKNGHTG